MIKYTLVTQDLNRITIEDILSTKFDAFTILDGVGYWKGYREDTLIIEIATPSFEDRESDILEICDKIKAVNHQEKIFLTSAPLSARLL